MTMLSLVCQSAVNLHKLRSTVGMANHKGKDSEVVAEKEATVKDLSYAFVKELTDKQNKRIYIVEEFNVTGRDEPIEGKFYSRFNEANTKVFAERQQHWSHTLENRRGSQQKWDFPVLESHTYGWLPGSLSGRALKRINYIQAPKQRCEMTAYDENLISERVTQRPKFTGVRFNLN